MTRDASTRDAAARAALARGRGARGPAAQGAATGTAAGTAARDAAARDGAQRDGGGSGGGAPGGPPSALSLLWGAPEAPRRGPKPALSRERLVEAAIAVADADGLGALSMSRIAERLGFTPMSLYRHVASKDDLLLLMLNTALGLPPEPAASPGHRAASAMVAPDADADAGWRRALEAWSRTYYERCLEHPWITRIEIGGPPMLPNQIAWMDRGLAPIAGTGLSGAEQLSTILMLSIYAMSAAQLTSDIAQAQRARAGGRGASGGPGAPAGQASTAAGDVLGEDVSQDGAGQDGAGQDGAGQDGAGQDGGYGQQLARILDPARFPALSAIVATMELDDPVRPPDAAEVIADELHAEFFFGLDRMLDGVDVLVRARAATAG